MPRGECHTIKTVSILVTIEQVADPNARMPAATRGFALAVSISSSASSEIYTVRAGAVDITLLVSSLMTKARTGPGKAVSRWIHGHPRHLHRPRGAIYDIVKAGVTVGLYWIHKTKTTSIRNAGKWSPR